MRKILLVLALLASSFAALPAFAQSADSAIPIPRVKVISLALTEPSYRAGDLAKGSFVLENKDNAPASNIFYRISLNGGYQGGMPATMYDSIMMGPVALAPLEKKTFSLSYRLPAAFSGDLGIQVRALQNGSYPLSWADTMIKVTGGDGYAAVSGPALIADGISFDLQAGPVVKKSVLVSGSLQNSTASDLAIIPAVSISNRADMSKMAYAAPAPEIDIKAGKTAKFSIKLPTFDFKSPGVYVGTLSFPDSSGILRAPSIDFRYILGGNIVTLYSASVDRNSVKAGEAFSVKLGYSGSPYDISTGDLTGIGGERLSIGAFNEKNEQVASFDGPENFDSGKTLAVPLAASADAQALRADIRAYDANGTLASFSIALSALPPPAAPLALSLSPQILRDSAIVLAALIALLILIHHGRKKKILKAFMLAFLLLGSFALFSPNAKADFIETDRANFSAKCLEGGVVDPALDKKPPSGGRHKTTDCYFSNDMSPDVIINTPGDNLQPGDTFYVTGTVMARRCGNNPEKLTYEYAFGDDAIKTAKGKAKIIKGQPGGVHSFKEAGADFSFGPFTVPTDPGDYAFTLTVTNTQRLGGLKRWGTTSGYADVFVPGGEPPVSDRTTGSFDSANCSNFHGWACDPDNTDPADGKIDVTFYDGVPAGVNLIGDSVASVPGDNTADGNAIAGICNSADHRFDFDPAGTGIDDGQAHSIYALANDDPSHQLGVIAIPAGDPTCVPAPEQCSAGHILDPDVPGAVAPDDCVCPAGTAEDQFGNCAPFQDQCTNLTSLGLTAPDGGGPYEYVPDGYYQDDGTQICHKQIDCDLSAAQCNLSQCDAPDGYRHLNGSCSFPDYCSQASIVADETELSGDNGAISCDDPEGEDVFPSDIDFSGLLHANGQCTLSWRLADVHDDVPPVTCQITSDVSGFDPISLSGKKLNGTQNIDLPATGARYTISCSRQGQARPALKVTQCSVDKSPSVKEI